MNKTLIVLAVILVIMVTPIFVALISFSFHYGKVMSLRQLFGKGSPHDEEE